MKIERNGLQVLNLNPCNNCLTSGVSVCFDLLLLMSMEGVQNFNTFFWAYVLKIVDEQQMFSRFHKSYYFVHAKCYITF